MSWISGLESQVSPTRCVPGLGSRVPPKVPGLGSHFSDMSFFYEKFLREVKKSES